MKSIVVSLTAILHMLRRIGDNKGSPNKWSNHGAVDQVEVIDLLKTITRTVTLFVTDSGCIHSWADFRGSKGCVMAWA